MKQNKIYPVNIAARMNLLAVLAIGLIFSATPAFAGQNEANNAISRADAKIEMTIRQAGLVNNQGDQSYDMARNRLINARVEFKNSNYDRAERLADEASILAELTAEKAKLGALKTSNAALTKSNSNN
jgi:outer membrane PBP1 activator LpoA protein